MFLGKYVCFTEMGFLVWRVNNQREKWKYEIVFHVKQFRALGSGHPINALFHVKQFQVAGSGTG